LSSLSNHTGHKGAAAEARALIRYVFYSTPEDILKPGGVPIGSSGSSANIREVKGDVDDALDLLARLAQAGGGFRDITPSGYPGIMIELNSGGIAAVRDEMLRSPGTNATLDVNNIPNVSEIKKIKFNP
jgi:hypothetical protein